MESQGRRRSRHLTRQQAHLLRPTVYTVKEDHGRHLVPARPSAPTSQGWVNSDGLPLCGDPWLDEALRTGELGWRVLPLHNSRAPLVDLVEASGDRGQIQRWWMRWPWCGWGLATGQGLTARVIEGPQGAQSWSAMITQYESWQSDPEAWALTSGGPPGRTGRVMFARGYGATMEVGPGLTWRGTDDWVVLPRPGQWRLRLPPKPRRGRY